MTKRKKKLKKYLKGASTEQRKKTLKKYVKGVGKKVGSGVKRAFVERPEDRANLDNLLGGFSDLPPKPKKVKKKESRKKILKDKIKKSEERTKALQKQLFKQY